MEKTRAQKSVVALCKEFGATKEQTVEQLMAEGKIDKDAVKDIVEKMWDRNILFDNKN